jgi:signal transduction histidine kinase
LKNSDPSSSSSSSLSLIRYTPKTDIFDQAVEQSSESKIKVIQDPFEIKEIFVNLIKSAKYEILFFAQTSRAFHREERIGVINLLEVAAAERGVRVKVILPTDVDIEEKLSHYSFDFRLIERSPTQDAMSKILVVDRQATLIIELKDDSQEEFTRAIGLATLSVSKPTVLSYVSFFETLWQESESREREERARREAQLLSDILTHDIRNYNQASRMSAELLANEVPNNEEVRFLVETLIQSIDDSTQLVDRAKKLGKILSEHDAKLYPVSLNKSIEDALSSVRDAYADKIMEVKKFYGSEHGKTKVLADNLLNEVLVNIFSNAMKYTYDVNVPIEISLEEPKNVRYNNNSRGNKGSNGKSFIKITIADHGTGIPDESKKEAFNRYFGGRVGGGLGLSIVRGLVTDRYHGKLILSNRIKEDYTQGTNVEVWLLKA